MWINVNWLANHQDVQFCLCPVSMDCVDMSLQDVTCHMSQHFCSASPLSPLLFFQVFFCLVPCYYWQSYNCWPWSIPCPVLGSTGNCHMCYHFNPILCLLSICSIHLPPSITIVTGIPVLQQETINWLHVRDISSKASLTDFLTCFVSPVSGATALRATCVWQGGFSASPCYCCDIWHICSVHCSWGYISPCPCFSFTTAQLCFNSLCGISDKSLTLTSCMWWMLPIPKKRQSSSTCPSKWSVAGCCSWWVVLSWICKETACCICTH